MDITSIIILLVIGLFAGILSGFIGVGGGIVIVPCLIYFLGLGQHAAQGTSLAMMLPPIGILAAYNYYKAGEVNITFALILAISFIIGGYFGSKFSLRLSEDKVKLIFGLIMLYVSIRLIFGAAKKLII